MIHIEVIVRKLLPELCKDQELSIICLASSNPVYLVFFENRQAPVFVVRYSKSKNICDTHEVTRRLYKILGDMTPEPLALVENNGQNISIQRGLDGHPWFQLIDKYSSASQRQALYVRAIETLNQFHLAVSSSSEMVKTVHPGNELRRSYQECIEIDVDLPASTQKLVEKFSKPLDQLGEISWFFQHGDFCLNNLIINDVKMHIIDFEDFGVTSMPLFDQFTLALSFYQVMRRKAPVKLSNVMKECLGEAVFRSELDVSCLPGLFLHHLLLRLGSWSQNRIEYRHWLLAILEDFSHSPEVVFQEVYN